MNYFLPNICRISSTFTRSTKPGQRKIITAATVQITNPTTSVVTTLTESLMSNQNRRTSPLRISNHPTSPHDTDRGSKCHMT